MWWWKSGIAGRAFRQKCNRGSSSRFSRQRALARARGWDSMWYTVSCEKCMGRSTSSPCRAIRDFRCAFRFKARCDSRGETMSDLCVHLKKAHNVKPNTDGCEECLKMGDDWVHLRLCLTCGHVGCCDDSKNKHATKHYHATKHPVIRSIEPGESWEWCY